MESLGQVPPRELSPLEKIEHRGNRWRREANVEVLDLPPLKKLSFTATGQVAVGKEQLQPENPENPMTQLYLYRCPQCHFVGKGYKNGFKERVDRPRYFVCNSCSYHVAAHEPLLRGFVLVSSFLGFLRLAVGRCSRT